MLHRVYLWWTEVPLMAEALVEERHLLKSLRWWDGFVIALCNPGFLIASLGFSMGALGTWGAVALWAISAGVGMLQAWIYAETASMFPDKPGGISLYAHEGWRGRAHGAAGDLHPGAVSHRGLAQLQHDLGDPRRVRRLQAGHGLPVPVRLVLVRGRGMRDLRPGIPRHPARYDDGAAFGRRVHA